MCVYARFGSARTQYANSIGHQIHQQSQNWQQIKMNNNNNKYREMCVILRHILGANKNIRNV